MVEQRKPMDRRLALVFAAGLVLGGGAAAWAVLHMNAPERLPVAEAPPAVKTMKTAEPVKASAPAPAPAPVAMQSHVPCPSGPVIAAASRDDGMMRLKSEPDTPAEISALILTGKESAAAGRARDAELTFLAACKAADKLQLADASEPTDARYQLARHYSHYVLVGSAPATSRTELLKRAEALYTDAQQSYQARYGAEHEKTRFAVEGLAALRQSEPTLAQATPAAPAAPVVAAAAPAAPAVKVPAPPKAVAVVAPPPAPAPVPAPKAVAIAEPKPAEPKAAPRPTVVESPPPPLVAEAPRPRRAPRVVEPEPDVVEAPVRQATGSSTMQ